MTVSSPTTPTQPSASSASADTAGTAMSAWPKRRVSPARLIRSELRWVFRRPRTWVLLTLVAAVPVLMGIVVKATASGGPVDSGAPVFVSAATSALALPIGAFTVLLAMLLPVTVTMSAGDALAGEQSNGSLRGWLLAPVARGRLLAVKTVGVLAVALAAAALVATTGLATGLIFNGFDGMTTISGTTLSFVDGLGRVAVAVVWVALYLMAVGAVALAVSASTDHPMVVVVSVIGGLITCQVLMVFQSLSWLHPFLLQQSLTAPVDLLRDPVDWSNLGEGAFRSLCYVVIGLSIAYARTVTRDG